MQLLSDDIHLLEIHDQRHMPWKNGRGMTRELAVHPPDAGLDGNPFLWRISIAEVTNDGPFSPFPGYDRCIMLIAGNGMQLSIGDAEPVQVVDPFRPLRFSGDAATYCRLLDGPVCDFNVMSARGRIAQRCDVISGGAVDAVWQRDSDMLFCHCLQGTLIVKMPNTTEWKLNTGQSLWFRAESGGDASHVLLAPNSPDSVSILVTLSQIRT